MCVAYAYKYVHSSSSTTTTMGLVLARVHNIYELLVLVY